MLYYSAWALYKRNMIELELSLRYMFVKKPIPYNEVKLCTYIFSIYTHTHNRSEENIQLHCEIDFTISMLHKEITILIVLRWYNIQAKLVSIMEVLFYFCL